MKENRVLSVLIVIVSILLLGVCGYIVYDKVSNQKLEEEDITSYDIKKALDKKIDILEIDYDLDIYRYARIYENNSITNEELDETDKLFKILAKIYGEKDNYSAPITTDYDFGSMENYKDTMVQINQEEVEELYYSVFGTRNFTNKKVNGCPMFIYDQLNKKYYGSAQCGGTTTNFLSIYKYKYTYGDNSYYVYLSLGSAKVNENENGFSCYRDYEMTNSFECPSVSNHDIVTEDNYEEFSQYKYTFVKNENGDYAFSKLERIK